MAVSISRVGTSSPTEFSGSFSTVAVSKTSPLQTCHLTSILTTYMINPRRSNSWVNLDHYI
jgi:hypothetical protein